MLAAAEHNNNMSEPDSSNQLLDNLPGIDPEHPPTEKWEKRGWYLWDFASSGFFYGTIDLLAILVVDQAAAFAKDAWCKNEYNISKGDAGYDECFEKFWAEDYENKGFCSDLKAFGADIPTATLCEAENGTWIADWDKEATLIPFMGFEIAHVALYAQATTIMLVFQFLGLFFFGALNDFGYYRKRIFVVCNALTGLLISLIYLGNEPEDYVYNTALLIIIQVVLNFSAVSFNSWLPLLIRATPEVDEAYKNNELTLSEKFHVKEKVSSNISVVGTVVAFAGAVFFMTILLVMALFTPLGNDERLMLVGALIFGLWFIFVTSISGYLLKARPGPPVPKGSNIVTVGIKRMCHTVKLVRKLPELLKFVVASLIYGDGNATIGAVIAVFASQELYMGTVDVLIMLYEAVFSYALGAALAIYFKNKYDLDPKKIILYCLFVIGLCPLYSIFGLTQPIELFIMVPFYGTHSGALQAFTRSIFATMIPKGHEAEFFTLLQLTDKGTSFLGPLVVTAVATKTGSIRKSFATLVLFFYLGALVMIFYNQEKSDLERKEYERTENEKENGQKVESSVPKDKKPTSEVVTRNDDMEIQKATVIPEEETSLDTERQNVLTNDDRDDV